LELLLLEVVVEKKNGIKKGGIEKEKGYSRVFS